MKDMDIKVQEVYRTPNRCENEKKSLKPHIVDKLLSIDNKNFKIFNRKTQGHI